MNKTQELQTIFATLLKVAPQDIGPDTSLATLNTSLAKARVRLALKRLGLTLPPGADPKTFGALQTALSMDAGSLMTESPASVSKPAYKAATTATVNIGLSGLEVGLDIENIHSLPEATDYWEHEFYRGSFAKSEIAYAVLAQEPRLSFAGFWCAKEALRKCDGSFSVVDPSLTAVAHDADGRPYLTLISDTEIQRLSHSVSISHTDDIAMAIVAVVSVPPSSSAAEVRRVAEDTSGSVAKSEAQVN